MLKGHSFNDDIMNGESKRSTVLPRYLWYNDGIGTEDFAQAITSPLMI